MVERLATAQDRTPAEPSQPLRQRTSQDETLEKQAGIIESNVIKACVPTTIGVDVEKGGVTTKVHEDESRYLSGSKLIFLFLWVYHKLTTRLVDPIYQRLAALYFPW